MGLGLTAGLAVGVVLTTEMLDDPSSPGFSPHQASRRIAAADERSVDPAATGTTDTPPLSEPPPVRGRVQRPEPASRPPVPEPQPAPAPPPPTTAEVVALVRRALSGAIEFEAVTGPASLLPPNAGPVALAVVEDVVEGVERDDGPRAAVARSLAAHLTIDDAIRALTTALADGPEGNEKLLVVAWQLADRADDTDDDSRLLGLAIGLLSEPNQQAREAGIYLAGGLDPIPTDALRRVAESDPEEWLRDEALSALLSADSDAGRDAAAPIVFATAMSGGLERRREALWQLTEMGPEAAETALHVLREGGLTDEEIEPIVDTIMGSGRIDDLVRAAGDDLQVMRYAAAWISDVGVEGDDLKPILSHFPRLLAAADFDYATELIWAVAVAGEYDMLEREALRPDTDPRVKRHVVATLFEPDWTEEMADWAPIQSRAAALARRLLETGDAKTRRQVAQLFVDNWYEFVDPGTRAHVETTLSRTARGDRNEWVRLSAAQALRDMRDEDLDE